MNIKNVLAGVAVKDLEASIRWYEGILEEPPERPMPEVAEWEFERGGWLQVFEDEDRAGHSSVTFSVRSLDSQRERLTWLAIPIGQEIHSATVNCAIVHDLDGNQLVFAESHEPALAQ